MQQFVHGNIVDCVLYQVDAERCILLAYAEGYVGRQREIHGSYSQTVQHSFGSDQRAHCFYVQKKQHVHSWCSAVHSKTAGSPFVMGLS